MKKILTLFLVVFLVFSSGCAKLKHLDQLLTLKAFSEEQDKLVSIVANQDKSFDLLRSSYLSGKLGSYQSKTDILKDFGKPILIEADKKGPISEIWLYRYSTKYFSSDKIYLYFDDKDKLSKIEYEKFDKSE